MQQKSVVEAAYLRMERSYLLLSMILGHLDGAGLAVICRSIDLVFIKLGVSHFCFYSFIFKPGSKKKAGLFFIKVANRQGETQRN